MIRPHEMAVIIKPEKPKETTESGLIYIPEIAKEELFCGEVVSVGEVIEDSGLIQMGELVYFLKGKTVEDDDGNKICFVSAVIDIGNRKVVISD